MKRRELKKVVNNLSSELFAECIFALHYQNVKNREDIENVMRSIVVLRAEMISRISHVEPGSTKLFFKKINQELTTASEDIVEQIKALI